jgi:hypothetical protein
MTLHTPDARTLVATMPGQPLVQCDSTSKRWGAAWKQVERAGYIVLFDNRAGRWTRSMADNKALAPAAAVLGTPSHLAFGLHWGDRVTATIAADWEQPPVDADVTRGEATIRGLIESVLKAEMPQDATERLMHDLLAQMVSSARVRRDGKVVTVGAGSETKWVDLLKAIPMEEKAQADVKSGEK